MKNSFYIICTLIFTINLHAFSQEPNYLWARSTTDTVGATTSYGRGVATDMNGNVIVAGFFGGSRLVFDADTVFNSDITLGLMQHDVFVVKYDELGNVLWAKGGGGVSEDEAYDVCTDINGNVFVTGQFYSNTVTFGSYTLAKVDMRDVFIVKYDPLGNVLWAKSAGGTGDDMAYGVACDANGNVIITGKYQSSSITFGSAILTNSGYVGGGDIFVVKYDSLGNVVWAKSDGGYDEDIARGISTDVNGNIFVVGDFYSATITYGSSTLVNAVSTGTSADCFFAKYDAAGNVLWAQSASGSATEFCTGVDTDDNSNVIITGSFQSPSITVAGVTLTRAGTGQDLFLVKYDSLGALLWAKRDGGVNYDFPRDVSVDSFGEITVIGNFSGFTTIYGTTTLTTYGADDIFIAKYDAAGNSLWAKSAGNGGTDIAHAVTSDENNNLLVVGTIYSTSVTFGTITTTCSSGTNFYVVKVNNSKGLVWPGDVNADHIVDNSDLLPIGIYYSQTGVPRTVMGNVWQADSCVNWGTLQTNDADIKHADCNGDGIIDNNDTLAININFGLTHAFMPAENDLRMVNPSLYFTTASGAYLPGSWINVDIMAGTSTLPVDNLYGIAFNLQYDASLVQPGTESLIYPNSWFASPGADAIKIGVVDPLASTAYAAETRIDQTNKDGYGKIATFRFQAKSSISSLSNMNFSYSGYVANDSAGNNILFNPQSYSIVIDPLATAIEAAAGDDGIKIFPNPNNGNFAIVFTSAERSDYRLKVINVLGQVVYSEDLPDFTGTYSKSLSLDKSGKGVYTITLSNDKNEVVKKIIVY